MIPEHLDPIPAAPPDAPEATFTDEGVLVLHEPDGTPEPWRPRTIGGWAWLSRKYLAAVAHRAEIVLAFDAEIERVEAARAKALRSIDRTVTWSRDLLVRTAETELRSTPDRDHYVTPHLVIRPTRNPVSVVVDDGDAAIEWLAKHKLGKDMLNIKITPALAVIKKAVKSYGPLDAVKTWRDVKPDMAGSVWIDVLDAETGEASPAPIPGLSARRGVTWVIDET